MPSVTLEEAQASLARLIEGLRPGEVLTITRNQRPIAQLSGVAAPERAPRKLGTLKGTVLHMAPDFDAPLDDFREYME
jgi:antitoxin (DNA-binding transcriptional repressor) of toxin-antitoxin stability system